MQTLLEKGHHVWNPILDSCKAGTWQFDFPFVVFSACFILEKVD